MKTWKKTVAGACAVTMLASMLTVPAYADEKVELTFCDSMSSPERQALFEDLFSRYEEQTGVKVEYTTVPYEEAEKKFIAMAATESLPDIIATGGATTLAYMGALEPLDEYWENFKYRDEIMPATQAFMDDIVYYNDHYWSFPDGYLVRGVFVRTDWMEEAGLNPDDYKEKLTWDDYFKIIEAINDPENGRYGIAYRGGAGNTMGPGEYLQSVMGWNNIFLSDDQSIYGTEEALEYMGKHLDLYKNGYAPEESINWGYPEMVEGFVSGQCGTLIQTPEVVPICEESMEEGTWAVLPWPTQDGVDKDVMVWGSSTAYCMSAYSEHKDEAWNLLEWLSSPEINLEYCKKFSVIPIHQSALEDPFFADETQQGYVVRLLSDTLYTTKGMELIPDYSYFSSFAQAELQKYMMDEQDLETSLKNLDEWLVSRYAEVLAGNAETEAAE